MGNRDVYNLILPWGWQNDEEWYLHHSHKKYSGCAKTFLYPASVFFGPLLNTPLLFLAVYVFNTKLMIGHSGGG